MNDIVPLFRQRRLSVLAALHLTLATVGFSGSAAVPTATGQQRQQQDQKAIADAQKKLADDTKAIDQVQKDAQQAAALLQQARTKAFQDAATRLGLPKVQSELNAARGEADRLTKELTKAVKEQPDYLQAVKDADPAREKLNAVRDDKTLAEEERRRQTDELSKALRAPVEMIRTRLDTDSTLQAARKATSAAQVELTNLQRQAAMAVQQDAAVVAATKANQEATDKQTKAKADLDNQRKAVAAAQTKLVQDQQPVQPKTQPARRAGAAMVGGAAYAPVRKR